MHVCTVSNVEWAVPFVSVIPAIKPSEIQTLDEKKKKESSNAQNFPIYQNPTRVVDVEADPSEEAAATPLILRLLFRACRNVFGPARSNFS